MREWGRQAARVARRWIGNPGIFVASAACMAIGIGGVVAVWAVFDASFLRPLPFEHGDRLVVVSIRAMGPDGRLGRYYGSEANWEIIRGSPAFAGLAAALQTSFDVSADGEPVERIDGARVSPDWFDVLRSSVRVGRQFGAEDAGSNVAVISEGYWRSALGSDSGVVGGSITVDAVRYRVVGVLHDEAVVPPRTKIWIPRDMTSLPENERQLGNLLLVGRLAQGMTVAVASQRMAPVLAEMLRVYPDRNHGRTLEVRTLRASLIDDGRGLLIGLVVGAALLFLIACSNLANLSLALFRRDAPRYALCAVLGARRGRLVRGAVGEALMLALTAAVAGVALAAMLVPSLRAFAGLDGPLAIGSPLDPRVLAITVVVVIVAASMFAAAPMIALDDRWTPALLSELGRGRSAGGGRIRFQRALIGLQTVMGVVLMMTAALANQRLDGLASTDPGFRTDVLTVRVGATASRYAGIEARSLFFEQVLESIRGIPGVVQAGASSVLPVGDPNVNWRISIEEKPPASPLDVEIARGRLITDGYFAAMGIPVLRGRDFGEGDGASGAPVAIVSRAMAEHYWPGQDAVGKRIKRRTWDSPFPWMTVVGVVGDVRDDGPGEDIGLTFYMPVAQIDTRFSETLSYAIRSDREAEQVVAAIRERIARIDPGVAVFRITTMRERLAETMSGQRLSRAVLGTLGVAGILLLVAGLYGVVSQATHDRTVEIGVRIAFGAPTIRVLSLILRQSLDVVGVGIVTGILIALAETSLLSTVAGGGERPALRLWIGVPAVILLVAGFAVLLPALRACRTDPAATIRGEA
jgi:putative ABC transport system permease protein